MNVKGWGINLLVHLMLLGLIGCSTTGPGPQPPPTPPSTVTHQFQVSHHTAVPITAAEADQILDDATNVIQTNNGGVDVACRITMVRNGGIGTFAGPRFINSLADINQALSLPGEIKVVDQINWCSGFSPNIIGCAPIPGNSLVVVRFTQSLEGILWLHEFGHNQGLHHRNNSNAVMAPTIDPARTHVNGAECTAFEVP